MTSAQPCWDNLDLWPGMATEAYTRCHTGQGSSEEIQVSCFTPSIWWQMRGPILLASYGLAQQEAPGSPNCPMPRMCSSVPGSFVVLGEGDAGGASSHSHHSTGNYSLLRPRETLESAGRTTGGCGMQRGH